MAPRPGPLAHERLNARMTCSVPGCNHGIKTGEKLVGRFCRKHLELFRRHGCTWRGSYTASELASGRRMVWNWIEAHSEEAAVKLSLAAVLGLFARGVPQETRQLSRQSASAKASAVWARFGEVEADPRIIAAAALAIVLRVTSDHASGKAPGGEEFRDVQIAKLILRLAGGSVKRWPSRLPNGEPKVLRWFISSEGRVLRVLGHQAAEAVAPILDRHTEELRTFVEAGISALGDRKINPYPEQKRVKPKPPIPAELKSKSANAEPQTARKETGQPKVFRLETNGKLVRLS